VLAEQFAQHAERICPASVLWRRMLHEHEAWQEVRHHVRHLLLPLRRSLPSPRPLLLRRAGRGLGPAAAPPHPALLRALRPDAREREGGACGGVAGGSAAHRLRSVEPELLGLEALGEAGVQLGLLQ